MSHTSEVPIILGRPDYDLPLGGATARADGMAVTGRDSLSYLWRFAGDRASLWAIEGGAVGAGLGSLRLDGPAPEDVEARLASLREAQARMRAAQTAYVQLAETLLSMAGAEQGALRDRLHAIRERLGDELLMFTDPADDGAHAQLRMLPEIVGIDGEAAPEPDREKLRPLAVVLLRRNAGKLGIDDPDALLALASR